MQFEYLEFMAFFRFFLSSFFSCSISFKRQLKAFIFRVAHSWDHFVNDLVMYPHSYSAEHSANVFITGMWSPYFLWDSDLGVRKF